MSLAEYYEKVKKKKWDLRDIIKLDIDLNKRCPLCGGEGCVQFIGYYHRCVVTKDGDSYDDFPIARYLCRRKGKRRVVNHRTFSLLPRQLVPYKKYSVEFMMKQVKARYVEGKSCKIILDDLFSQGQEVSIDKSQILGFDKIIEEAIDKILARGWYSELKEGLLRAESKKERMKVFVEFSEGFECTKVNPWTKGASALGYDFYLNEGGYYQNGWFLFGKPSQFRGG